MKQVINGFSKLGQIFLNFIVEKKEDKYFQKMSEAVQIAEIYNAWFTLENINYCLKNWANALIQENLEKWLSKYNITTPYEPKKVGIIMAGNIPLVGFHDFLCTLICGHNAYIKLSSDDKILLPAVVEILVEIEPNLKTQIHFEKDQLKNLDMVIATGNDNTARYFEYYFKNIPSVIRKNRTSVAVITSKTSDQDFKNLADDIFNYYGLGCRSVSKVFVPQDFDLDKIFGGIFHKKGIVSHTKYFNNYEYNKTVYLMSQNELIENGFCLFKKDENYNSPIAVLFYEYYKNENELTQRLQQDCEKLQCIVGNTGLIQNEIPFGQSQQPQLWDYADNIDTIKFLTNA